MAFIRKIKGSLVQMDRTNYVGEDTYLFYDIDTGCLYRHNGTPGGEPICGGAGSNGGVLSFDTFGDFPFPGTENVIYIALDTELIYYWDATDAAYVQLLSSVPASNDVLEYPNTTLFPPTGDAGILYIDAANNILYRWNGSAYVSVGSGVESATAVIPATSTATLYTVTPTANLSLKFILSATDAAGNFATAEVLGSYKKLDNSVSHTHYALLGDNLRYRPDLVYQGPTVQLNIVNNEAVPMTVQVTRVPTIEL